MKDIGFWSKQKTPDEVMDTVGGAFGNAAMIIKSAALDARIPIDNGLLQELFEYAGKAAAIAFRLAEDIRRGRGYMAQNSYEWVAEILRNRKRRAAETLRKHKLWMDGDPRGEPCDLLDPGLLTVELELENTKTLEELFGVRWDRPRKEK